MQVQVLQMVMSQTKTTTWSFYIFVLYTRLVSSLNEVSYLLTVASYFPIQIYVYYLIILHHTIFNY